MKIVSLSDGSQTSRLGFGASRLHHLHSQADRQRLLESALDLGFQHIDVAPSYGEGLAEREIGRLIASGTRSFTLVTKFGLPPASLADRAPRLAYPVMAARSLLRRAGLLAEARPMIDASALRASLEGSLRRLRTDHVDLILLHEPAPERLGDPESLLAALTKLRDAGKIGGWGLAGAWRDVAAIAEASPGLAPVVQTAEREWPDEAARKPDITYGVMSTGPQRFPDKRQDAGAALLRLELAIRRRPEGAFLVSTSQAAHLKAMAELEAAL
jgi:D-threo-aldose 1-dehydrogenase